MMNSSSLSRAIAGVVFAGLSIAAAIIASAVSYPHLMMIGLVAALSGIALAGWQLAVLTSVMRKMTMVAERIARGDFEARILFVRDGGMLGRLQHGFNDSIDRCDAFVREASAAMGAIRDNKYHRRILPKGLHGSVRVASETINEAMEAIRQRVAAFNANTSQFEGAISAIIEEVSGASEKMRTTASVLGDGATATRERAKAVAQSSEHATANMETVAAATTELAASAREIGQDVNRSAAIAREAVAKVEHASRTIASLSSATARIDEIVELINAIAAQTNLLALNATIEAARAGEAGKGFTVVAHEVKSLAGQTARATQDISRSIVEVQTITKEAVGATTAIGSTICEVDTITTHVAQAVEAQSQATQEIARNIEEAFAGVREIAANIRGVTENASESERQASMSMAASGGLANQAQKLGQSVKEFLLSLRRGPHKRDSAAA
jgi:methyl-accepting chemotaxis protein